MAAAVTVTIGIILVALAAFVLSYAGIRQMMLAAGASGKLAALYPLVFDVMLVIACVTALALRDAEWWTRAFAWLSTLALLAAAAAANVVRAANITFPHQLKAATMAVVPWVLVLLGLGLGLSLLRHYSGSRRATATLGHLGSEAKPERKRILDEPLRSREPTPRTPPWAADPDSVEEDPSQQYRKRAAPINERDTPAPLLPYPPQPATRNAEPDHPDVRLLPPGPKPAAAGAEPDDPDVRLLPPGPKPAAAGAEPDDPDVRLLPPGPKSEPE